MLHNNNSHDRRWNDTNLLKEETHPHSALFASNTAFASSILASNLVKSPCNTSTFRCKNAGEFKMSEESSEGSAWSAGGSSADGCAASSSACSLDDVKYLDGDGMKPADEVMQMVTRKSLSGVMACCFMVYGWMILGFRPSRLNVRKWWMRLTSCGER